MKRLHFLKLIKRYFQSHPIVAMLGPRQCGKTTLARMYCAQEPLFQKNSHYFDLENPIDIERLQNPFLTLKPLTGLIVIDEIQRLPNLFSILRVLVDEAGSKQKYLILGSASRELLHQTSESLAGRIAYLELTPFSFLETNELEHLWVRGGFPKSYLAESEEISFDWRESYVRTFLEQDIPALGIQIPPNALGRFWAMLSHYHGNIFNASELGRSFGASDLTMRRYLDILSGTFMIRQLQPWHANISKRQVKTPKIYFRDSGILHSLLNIHNLNQLHKNPKLGASWEGFALEEIIRASNARGQNCYFWSTYSGAEIDLLIHQGDDLIGFEFKYSDAPKMTKSMKISLEDLNLTQLYVIYPGDIDYQLSEKISVRGLSNFLQTGLE